MSIQNRVSIDTVKIRKAIEAGVPLLITTFTLPHEMELYMKDVLSFFLKELNQDFMTEYLTYCLSELCTNAKKANTKRIYFLERNLDIMSEADYKSGMTSFKKDTLENIGYYLQQQKNAGLYVKLVLQTRNGRIKIEIRNNSPATVYEYKRIHDKIARAQQYVSIEDAFSQIYDESEGAGLGLIIMILMLQKIGLAEENFQFLSENGETITRIILPLNPVTQTNLHVISQDLVRQIDELPHFPDNIIFINQLLSDPDSKLSDIAQQISNDVSLTADLLKLVNSAAFSLRSPCPNIVKAVQMVGTRGIKNLLYSVGSIQSLGEKTEEVKRLWTHSYQVAFYTYNLARNFAAGNRDLIEDSYVCGLLHDIGKVLFENAHPLFIQKCESLCATKNIPAQIMERLFTGVNHAEIGSMIAEKWNLPEVITQTIKYHHVPEAASEQYRTITEIVYLANMITHYQSQTIEYYQFEETVLKKYGIASEEMLVKISSRLEEAFNQQSETRL